MTVRSDGVRVFVGEKVILAVTATDNCGNSAEVAYDPSVEPSPLCDEVLEDGTCCPAIAPPDPDCDEPCEFGLLSPLGAPLGEPSGREPSGRMRGLVRRAP